MLVNTHLATYPWAITWARTRVQLGGALVLAALLPAVAIYLLIPGPSLGLGSIFDESMLGMTLGAVSSFYILRNLSTFPGVHSGYFVLPSALIGYGATFTLFLFLRLDYSRALLLSGFLLCVTWLYLANFFATRGRKLRIAVVPYGEVDPSSLPRNVEWTELARPDLAGGQFDALVADLRADLPDDWETFLADCALDGVAVFHVKQLRESLTGRVEIEHLSENSFGSLVPFMAYLRFRRLLDLISSLVVGAVLLPFLLIVALMIRLDSPGPALFRQRRMGYRGQPFMVMKFRTMAHGRTEQDQLSGAMTRHGDERVTRLGRFLRRTRVDELPQIYNIIKGEMSWIGPRPEAEVLSNWYEAELPFYRYRHIVPPGITGWAQVNQGHVAGLEQVNSKLHYDFYYIKNFSPWLDALIVFRTVQTVFSGFGSK